MSRSDEQRDRGACTLLGAAHGASTVPAAWWERVHGRPGLVADDLVRLAPEPAR